MYARCGESLDLHTSKDLGTWTARIGEHVHEGGGRDVLTCYETMRSDGISPNAKTFTCILKACGSSRALEKGENVHVEISRLGLLDNDVVLGTALVGMYAKCGVLAKAQQVLEHLPVRGVPSWNVLIAEYAEQGQFEQALDCFNQMQGEGLSPDEVTYICILKACGSKEIGDKGEEIHNEIAKQGLLKNDIVLGSALVGMYVKCGALSKARQVLEELPVRNVVSWSSLIAGYAQQGQGEQALNCFERMQCEGLSPNAVTFASILKACASIGSVKKGEKIHDEIIKQRLLGDNLVLGNALIDMYVKCSALSKAQQVLEELPARDVISWSTLIAGYAQRGQGQQALACFEQMQCEALSPNAVTFVSILKACGRIGATEKGEQVHGKIVQEGLLTGNIVLGNALVDMYVKCSALSRAQQVLVDLPDRDVVTWSSLIGGYAQQGQGQQALVCFDQMRGEGLSPNAVTLTCILKACGSLGVADKGEEIHVDTVKQGLLKNNTLLGNALVDMYVKCGALPKAQEVLEELPVRDVVTWNALIGGFAEQSLGKEALKCLEQMQSEGLSPDGVTFICILKACGSIGADTKGEQIHCEIARQGRLGYDSVLCTALVDMYAKCGALQKAQRLLQGLPVRDVASWNALIAGYVEQGKGEEALYCFESMLDEGHSPDEVTLICLLKACGNVGFDEKVEEIHDEIVRQGLLGKNMALDNALVEMYAKCGAPLKAQQVLEELPVRDAVSMVMVITGYVQQGQAEQALSCYKQMQRNGVPLDAMACVQVLKACGNMGASDEGEQIHIQVARRGMLGDDIVLGTALIDMYAKCGALCRAHEVLVEELTVRDAVSWNALIAGYAQQGWGEEALDCFIRMQGEGLSPDEATYSCVLNVCSRLGLLEYGQMYFENLSMRCGMVPDVEHYTCMIDLFGRAGHLDKAVAVVLKMPSLDDAVWSALLGACQKWGDVNVGRWAFGRGLQSGQT